MIADILTDNESTSFKSECAQPHVTVFILNWNRREETLRCLQSVRDQTYPRFDLLIVDNASSDGSPEAIRREFPEAQVEVLDQNYGCPGGRNRGIELACSEYVFCPDNDSILHRDAVGRAVEAIQQDKRIAIVSGHVRSFNVPEEIDTTYELPKDAKGRFLGTFSATAALYRKSIFKAVGGYPDNYFYAGEEDYLILNLISNGYLAWYEPNMILWHKKSTKARYITSEFVNRQVNGLANRVLFWPMEITGLWIFRELFRDPVQAVRAGLFWPWLKTWPSKWLKAFAWAALRRCPVDRKTFKLIQKLTWENIHSIDDITTHNWTYWRSIACVLKNGR